MHYFNEEVLGKLLKYQYKLLYPKVIFNRQKADEFCLLVWLFFLGGGLVLFYSSFCVQESLRLVLLSLRNLVFG